MRKTQRKLPDRHVSLIRAGSAAEPDKDVEEQVVPEPTISGKMRWSIVAVLIASIGAWRSCLTQSLAETPVSGQFRWPACLP